MSKSYHLNHVSINRQDERKRVRGLWGKDWTYYEEIRWDQKTTGGGSGGVGLLVRKDIGKVTRESRCCGEGVVSVRIERGGEVLFVIMVYLVPSGSKWYSRNAGIRERVASAVAEFKKEGTVVMIGDSSFFWNKNLEAEEGHVQENVEFLSWLLDSIK